IIKAQARLCRVGSESGSVTAGAAQWPRLIRVTPDGGRRILSPREAASIETTRRNVLLLPPTGYNDAPLFAGKPRKCGLDQANRITLPAACRFNNSLGDDFEHDFWLARVVKCLAGSIKGFVHGRKRLRVKHPRRYEGTD